jgi:hypothetical protein
MTILYVQHDFAVFGFGETREDAIVMAAQWLKAPSAPAHGKHLHPVGDEAGKQGCSYEYAENLLVNSAKPGQMTLYETAETLPADAENWVEKNCWTGIMMSLESPCHAMLDE